MHEMFTTERTEFYTECTEKVIFHDKMKRLFFDKTYRTTNPVKICIIANANHFAAT